MNKVYRLIWSHVQQRFVVSGEMAKGKGKDGRKSLIAAVGAIAASFATPLLALPGGGEVAAGQATISQQASTLVVQQASQKAVINWQSFNIAQNETVNFQQPNAAAVALNRIHDSNASQIFGQLNANGQIFLVNSNGINFAKGAEVNVGALTASTLDITDQNFLNGQYDFVKQGDANGVVSNAGTINANTIALLGSQVNNSGWLVAQTNGDQRANVALAAGDEISLSFGSNGLLTLDIKKGAYDALVENKQLIQADGGQVLLRAEAAEQLMAATVNNSGIIQAQSIGEQDGRIVLLADMDSGTTNVAGTLDASAPNSGNGGFIETSAATVYVAPGTLVTTKSTNGQSGQWLIDPNDFTIAASGGDITGATLSSNLDNNGSVVIQSLDGATDGNGDIFVNDAITWSSDDSVLSLQAVRNIEINAEIFASGELSGVILNTGLSYNSGAGDWSNTPSDEDYGASQHVKYGADGKITLSGLWSVYRQDGKEFFVVNSAYDPSSLEVLNIVTTQPFGSIALGEDIDASDLGYDFISGDFSDAGFDGLNHTISNLDLQANPGDSVENRGLFNSLSDAFVRNLHLDSISITSDQYEVGALAGSIDNTFVHNVHSSGTISAAGDVGGLIGNAYESTIENVSSSVNVMGISQSETQFDYVSFEGAEYIGGLIGSTDGSFINNASATGQVSGAGYLGGLVGSAHETSISDSRADGQVIGTGGWSYNLVANAETLELEQIQDNYFESSAVGGLVGELKDAEITSSHASGSVAGNNNVGGLVGLTYDSDISDVSAGGNVTGHSYLYSSSYNSSNSYHENEQTNESSQGGNSIGGLVGYLEYTDINQASASGDVSGRYAIGGLVGYAESYDDNSLDSVSASGKVTGIVGASASTYLYVSYSTETRVIDSEVVTVNIEQRNQSENSNSYSSYIGGLVGEMYGYSLNNAHATGNVSGGEEVGGLIGYAELYDDNSYNNISASGDVSGQLLSNSYSSTYQEFETIGETRTLVTSTSNSETQTSNGSDIGGLIGEFYSYSSISNAGLDNAHATGDVSGQQNVGGLIGYTYNYNTLISNSSASGNVNGVNGSYSTTSNGETRNAVSYSTAIGGFIGYAYGLQLDEVSASGEVNGGRNVGGLVGYAQSNNSSRKSREPEPEESLINIANSFATGAVNSVLDAAGGLIGYARGISLDNVFASGDVSATVDGYTGATYIENASYQGDNPILEISAGGLIGQAEDVTLSNAHATGDVSITLSGDIALEVYTEAGYYDSVGIESLSDVEESAPTQTLFGLTVSAGGLIGSSEAGQISNAFALGNVDINNSASLNFVSLSYDERGMGPMLIAEVIENSEEPTLIYQPFNVVIASAAGGLIGTSEGDSVNTAYATGDVSQVDSFQTTSNGPDGQAITFAKHALVGGLVGLATADMEDDGYDMLALSISAMDEPATSVSAGFEQAYAIGNVSYQGDSDAGAGGLMGQIDGIQIDQTFATGSVGISGNGGNASGGLIGLKDGSQGVLGYDDADMDYEYELMMAAEMPASDEAENASTISNSYWNSDANSQGIGEDAAPAEAAVNVAGLSVAELKQEDSYAGFEFGACGGDASWCIVEGKTVAGLNALYQSVAADISGLENYSKVYDGSAAFVAASGYSLDSGSNKLVFTEADFGLSNSSANAGFYGSDETSLDGIYSAQYQLALNAGDREITITKASLTITAFDDEHLSGSPYAGNNGSTVVGFVNGETEANLGGSLSYGGSAQGADQVGQYAISPQGFSSDNYDIVYIDGVLTVETSFDPALQAATNQANTAASVPSSLASPAGLLEFGAPAAGPDGEEIEVIMEGDVMIVNGGNKQPSLEEMLQAL